MLNVPEACESVLDVRDIEYVCRERVYSDEGQYNWAKSMMR